MDNNLIKKINEDSARWVAEGIITADARERILDQYRQQSELERKAGPGKLISTLSVMGAVLVGVGVVLFVSSNWKEMARWAKFCVLFFPMLACYAVGWWLRHGRANFPKVGAALMLLGTIIYGAAIFLVAQMYNISVHYPNGILMWWAAILPLAYLTGLVPILVLSLGCMLAWLGTEAGFWMSGYESFGLVGLYMMAGVVLWEAGRLHMHYAGGKSNGFVTAYLDIGLLTACIASFIVTFDDFLEMSRVSWSPPAATERPFVFIIVLFALALTGMLARIKSRAGDSTNATENWLGLTVLFIGALLAGFYVGSPEMLIDLTYLFANVLYLIFIVMLIWLGYQKRMLTYFNVGVVFFALLVIARYFDMFWGMMPRSVFFMAGGVLLITGGVFLEKHRRRVIATFGGGDA